MDVLSITTTIFGIVGFAGGAVGYFAKGRGDSIIAYQAKELEIIKNTASRLETENSALAAERDSLLEQNKTLTKLAQGSPQLKGVASQLSKLSNLIEKVVKERQDAKQ